ncbi:TonB-dependent siderophore receptor [Algicella marina]|uniref:TonB-dependent siderophore receptor n=1 Tax=Algicella marina TaxID=2683284 RepID=A0A6P1T111_9RHOB|nr:TonB-dependent siderophore receptor [Algicella marina]QHQ35136.1 TonB-dependent siderophore receptor [Algicella marina]
MNPVLLRANTCAPAPLNPRRLLLTLLACTALVAPTSGVAQENDYDLGTLRVEGADDDANSILAGSVTSSSKTSTDVLDTPASVSVVTEKEIETRKASNLQEILAYTAGVHVDEFGADDRYDYFRIRGFDQLSMGTYRDGLPVRGFGWTFSRREPYGFERVEVLKGSNSSLFGLNAPGGLVNGVSKTPKSLSFGEVYTSVGEDHAEIGTDFGGPIGDSSNLSYRLTAKVQDSAYSYDSSDDDRVFVAGGLSWRPSDATELTILADYNKRDGVPGTGFPTGVDVDIDSFFGEPDFNAFDTEEYSLGYKFSHSFANGLTFRSTARYSDLDLTYEQVYGASTDPTAPRSAFAVYSDARQFAIDNQLQYDTSFGMFDSRTLIGAEYTWIKVEEEALFGSAPGIDITDPTYCGRACVTLGPYVDWVPEQSTQSVYLQEELTIADRFIATVGGRYDYVDVTVGYPATGTEETRDYTSFTVRAGLTYKVTPGLSVYANYSESFEPNIWALAEDPKEGTQYEIGVKYRPESMNALFSAALFDLTQTNVNTYVTPVVQRQIGKVGVRGLELEGKFALSSNLNVTAAYSYWDAEILEDGIVGNEGNRPSRVPQHIGSIWADYTLPGDNRRGDMTFGAGVRYVGATYGDDANTVEVDGYTLVDAAFNYQMTESVGLGLNVTNLFDTEYRTSSYFGTDYYGDGRKLTATLRYDW